MSNVLADFLQGAGQQIVAPRVVCDTSDSYSTLWRRIFAQIRITSSKTLSIGLKPEEKQEAVSLADQLPEEISPDVVRTAVADIAHNCLLIMIIDEFDRFADSHQTRLFADTVEILSDYAIGATIVMVGVADAVDQLIEGHESVLRNLVQIPLPRMSLDELQEIVTGRLPQIGLGITDGALEKICLLSRGLPHYTHLISQYAAWEAIESGNPRIEEFHVGKATKSAIDNSQQTIQSDYHLATMSPRKDSLYAQVLLACALAECDDFGYFAAADVRNPMSSIMGREYDIPSFSRHLKTFCGESRGKFLQEIGQKYQRRFRFRNPLAQPYVVLRGIAEGLVSLSQVTRSPADFPHDG